MRCPTHSQAARAWILRSTACLVCQTMHLPRMASKPPKKASWRKRKQLPPPSQLQHLAYRLGYRLVCHLVCHPGCHLVCRHPACTADTPASLACLQTRTVPRLECTGCRRGCRRGCRQGCRRACPRVACLRVCPHAVLMGRHRAKGCRRATRPRGRKEDHLQGTGQASQACRPGLRQIIHSNPTTHNTEGRRQVVSFIYIRSLCALFGTHWSHLRVPGWYCIVQAVVYGVRSRLN